MAPDPEARSKLFFAKPYLVPPTQLSEIKFSLLNKLHNNYERLVNSLSALQSKGRSERLRTKG